MKAFLLAGGLGERLRPLTLEIPKCLVAVRGVPLLEVWLRLCERYSIDKVLLNVSQHPERVEAFLAQRAAAGPHVTLVREARPLGTAGTVRANRSFAADAESFWVIYSDNLTDMALDRMERFHRTHDGLLTMGLFRAANPAMSGIVEVDAASRIVRFLEKPEHPASDLANAGIYLARQSVLDQIPADQPLADFGHHVLPRLVGRMYGYRIDAYYADIGTPAALARAEAEWGGLGAASAGPGPTRNGDPGL